MTVKRCSKCGVEKPRDQFSKRSAAKDGLKPNCKACDSAYMRARYAADPKADNARSKAYREKNREKVLNKKREWYWRDPEARRQENRDRYYANRDVILEKMRQERLKNPEKNKEKCRRYYEQNKDRLLAYMSAYAKENPDVRRKAQRNYYLRNIDTIAAKAKAHRLANLEGYRERGRSWRKANPELVNAYVARYRATKLQRTRLHNPELLELVELEAYDLIILREEATGFPWEVDHIVPLQSRFVCGLHNEHNLAVIPRSINRAKSNLYWPDMP